MVRGVAVFIVALALLLVPTVSAQDGSELTETFSWPDNGLTFNYPQGWQLVGAQNFDFVLLGTPDSGDDQVYIGSQSGGYDTNESLQAVMERVAGDQADSLQETTIDDQDAWQFEFEDDTQRGRIVGYAPNSGRLNLLIFVAPADEWDEWVLVFEDIVEQADITPLELDHEDLNAQIQDSFRDDGSLSIGDPDAPLLLVEFSDFSCGHCANYSASIQRLIADYVEQGQLRITLHMMIGVGGEYSARAATAQYCAADMGVGWDAHELLWNEYSAKGAMDAYTVDNILDAFENAELSIDMDEFEDCLTDGDFSESLSATQELANELEVTGTPTVFLGTELDELERAQNRMLFALYPQLDELLSD